MGVYAPGQFTLCTDRTVVYKGRASAALIANQSGKQRIPRTIVQAIDAEPFQGKRLKFSAMVRTKRSSPEFLAAMWVRVQDVDGNVIAFQNMEGHPIPGESEWTERSLVSDVPKTAAVIMYGIFPVLAGSIWIDDVQIKTVSLDTPTTGPLGANGLIMRAFEKAHVLTEPTNLDFEESVPRGDWIYWDERQDPTFRAGE